MDEQDNTVNSSEDDTTSASGTVPQGKTAANGNIWRESTPELAYDWTRQEGIELFKVDSDSKALVLNEENAKKLLFDDPSIRDKEVVVISVAGAKRTGKSFLLNIMTRRLEHREANMHESADEYEARTEAEDWLQPEQPLVGFSWRNGEDGNTAGILAWKRLFLLKKVDGEDEKEIVILLLDTEGAFDLTKPPEASTILFTLTVMLSSLTIYNITNSLQANYLEDLRVCAEFGQQLKKDGNESSLQKLSILIRDWSLNEKMGFEEGKKIWDAQKQSTDPKDLVTSIKNTFDDISVFLMPSPGKAVRSASYDGKLTKLDPDFVEAVRIFVEVTLKSGNVESKKIGGSQLTCAKLFQLLQGCPAAFEGTDVPTPENCYIAMLKLSQDAAVTEAFDSYMENMNGECREDGPSIEENVLDDIHTTFLQMSVAEYEGRQTLGFKEARNLSIERLKACCLERYTNQFRATNNLKRQLENKIQTEKDIEMLKKMEKSKSDAIMSAIELYDKEMQKVTADRDYEPAIKIYHGRCVRKAELHYCKRIGADLEDTDTSIIQNLCERLYTSKFLQARNDKAAKDEYHKQYRRANDAEEDFERELRNRNISTSGIERLKSWPKRAVHAVVDVAWAVVDLPISVVQAAGDLFQELLAGIAKSFN